MKKVTIIGSGFAGLSSAATLAQKGYKVSLIEKHSSAGGRSRQFKKKGYSFDMGPSWYWMPDVFDRFFEKFNKKTSDYYDLKKLDPNFQVIFDKNDTLSIPNSYLKLKNLFENIETGSAKKLDLFMAEAQYKYEFSMKSLIFQPGLSLSEFFVKELFQNFFKLELFQSYKKHVRKHFNHPKLRALIEFPVLFLGTSPERTPALYSLMAYSGFKQGTYYPMGGFHKIIQGMKNLCLELGVNIISNETVKSINIKNFKAISIQTDSNNFTSDIFLSTADYNHTESLLPKKYRNYSSNYWEKRTFSPSCLIFYLGIGGKIKKLHHHNMFFDENIENHLDSIYNKKEWPKKPLFYVCCPSKTDPKVAPKEKENIFCLIPISPGLKDNPEIREHYFNLIMKRIENYSHQSIKDNIEFKRSYCIKDFIQDYNAFKGNAYGLANTLNQTAYFKPKIFNKKIKNLFYAGQLTVPGPGVPPSIISGQIVANHIHKKNTS